jgi:hypothetical protein
VRFPKGVLGLVLACLAGLVTARTLEARGPDRSLSASGTVVRVQAEQRTLTVTLSDGTEGRFFWSAETRISGVLTPGAKVTIRYDTGSDGRNVAQQISVSRN